MGRTRSKGKKELLNRGDAGSGEDEKLPVRRRGRPLKKVKENIVKENEVEKTEDEYNDETEYLSFSKNNENSPVSETTRKRNRPSLIGDNADSVNDENCKTISADVIKSVGFRQIGSRRKNKPRRAAEVGVECR